MKGAPIRRKDVGWAMCRAGELRRMLAEVPDGYEVLMHDSGTLMIFQPKPEPTYRRYVGYLDLAKGQVQIKPDGPSRDRDAPGACDFWPDWCAPET